jgi:hypothetical protein
MINDIGVSPRKWRVQFQAPPQVATYMFDLHIKSDSYCGMDIVQEVLLDVQDVSKLEETIVEEVIPESEEGMSPSLIMVNLLILMNLKRVILRKVMIVQVIAQVIVSRSISAVGKERVWMNE